MKITIKSTLADIAPEVYQAVNYQTAKAIIEEHLKDSHIKDEDRKKMLDGVFGFGFVFRQRRRRRRRRMVLDFLKLFKSGW
jgi:hypothetical protein